MKHLVFDWRSNIEDNCIFMLGDKFSCVIDLDGGD